MQSPLHSIKSGQVRFSVPADLGQKNIDEKLSFAPISFKLEFAYISQDSKNMKKKNANKNVKIVFDKYFQ